MTRCWSKAGALLWDLKEEQQPMFTIGSSGLTAGLVAHWRSIGVIGAGQPDVSAAATDRILVISGSCSVVTGQQILWARSHGYVGIELDAAGLASGDSQASEEALRLGVESLRSGHNTVLYTALGKTIGASSRPEIRCCSRPLAACACSADRGWPRGSVRRRHILTCCATTEPYGRSPLPACLCPERRCAVRMPGDATGLEGLELVLKGGANRSGELLRSCVIRPIHACNPPVKNKPALISTTVAMANRGRL